MAAVRSLREAKCEGKSSVLQELRDNLECKSGSGPGPGASLVLAFVALVVAKAL